MSERVARRCDDTVDKKRVNSCVLKHLFLERVEQPKISPNKPGNALSDAILMSCFQNFAAPQKENRARRGFFVTRPAAGHPSSVLSQAFHQFNFAILAVCPHTLAGCVL